MGEINICGHILEADFLDADFMERFEVSTQAMMDQIEVLKTQKRSSAAEGLRTQCRLVEDCFDGIFGEGTAAMIFGGRMNLLDHLEAFAVLTDSRKDSEAEVDAFTNKYLKRQRGAK